MFRQIKSKIRNFDFVVIFHINRTPDIVSGAQFNTPIKVFNFFVAIVCIYGVLKVTQLLVENVATVEIFQIIGGKWDVIEVLIVTFCHPEGVGHRHLLP